MKKIFWTFIIIISFSHTLANNNMPFVNIEGLNRNELIRQLWKNQKVASFFTLGAGGLLPQPPLPTDEDIEKQMYMGGLDYLNGRCIKTNFKNLAQVETRLYNRDAGEGKFEEIVRKMHDQICK